VVNLPGEGETEIQPRSSSAMSALMVRWIWPEAKLREGLSQRGEGEGEALAYMCLEIASEKPLVDSVG